MSSALKHFVKLSLQLSPRNHPRSAHVCPGCRRPLNIARSFASAPRRRNEARSSTTAPKHYTIEDLGDEFRADFDRSSPEEQAEMRKSLESLPRDFDLELPPGADDEIAREASEIERELPLVHRHLKPTGSAVGFWASDEDDEYGRIFDDDDNFQGDDITTPAHAELDLHRDMREYQRRAAWDMPLLRKFAQPFTPPTKLLPLRFRYTTYMGDNHPSAGKVVVTFTPSDLQPTHLKTQAHVNKLIKLAGVRYNPATTVIKMSCEKFDSPAQNKRYLGDLVNQLIAEATDPKKDNFEDVPFDFRHHKRKIIHDFPESWKLGAGQEETVQRLIEWRGTRKQDEEDRKERGEVVVDGADFVKEHVEMAEVLPTGRVGSMNRMPPRQLGRF